MADTEITFTRPSWGAREGDVGMRAEEVEGRRDREEEETTQKVFEKPWVARLIGPVLLERLLGD